MSKDSKLSGFKDADIPDRQSKVVEEDKRSGYQKEKDAERERIARWETFLSAAAKRLAEKRQQRQAEEISPRTEGWSQDYRNRIENQ